MTSAKIPVARLSEVITGTISLVSTGATQAQGQDIVGRGHRAALQFCPPGGSVMFKVKHLVSGRAVVIPGGLAPGTQPLREGVLISGEWEPEPGRWAYPDGTRADRREGLRGRPWGRGASPLLQEGRSALSPHRISDPP